MSIILDAQGVPIKPRERNELRKIVMAANLLEEPATMFVTSTRWGWIVDELSNPPSGMHITFADPTNLPKPGKQDRFKFGFLTVANAGTEDEGAVNLANWMSVPRSFLWKKRELARPGTRTSQEVEDL